MSSPSRPHPSRGCGWGSISWLLLLAFAAPASARIEVVSWSHVEPCSVESFELRYGDSPGALDTVVDVGRPRQAGGHFSYELEIPDNEPTWVCVAAVRGDETSDCSTAIELEASLEDETRSEPAPDEVQRSWCEDFSAGALSSGWVSTDAGLEVAEPGLFRVDRVQDLDTTLVTTQPRDGAHSHFVSADDRGVWGAQWSAYEFSGQMLFGNLAGGVGVTLYSRYPSATAYYRLGREPYGTAFRVDRDRSGPGFKCEPATLPIAPSAQQWYAFRIQADDEGDLTAIRAKVWPADRREPDGFQVICEDRMDRPLSGAIGVWAAGAGAKAWDSLHVSALSATSADERPGRPGKPELVP